MAREVAQSETSHLSPHERFEAPLQGAQTECSAFILQVPSEMVHPHVKLLPFASIQVISGTLWGHALDSREG